MLIKTTQTMTSSHSDDDSTSDIEAAILKRLTTWADPSEPSSALLRTTRPSKSIKKPRRTKPRRQPSHLISPPHIHNHDDIQNLQQSLAASADQVAKRVLDRTIIKPRPETSTLSHPRTPLSTTAGGSSSSSSSQPVVVKARELRPNRKPRESTRLSSASRHPADSANDSKQGAQVDAAQFVDSHRREVGRFGSQALHKRDRKTFQAAELLRLGCRPPKKGKVPIGLLVRKRDKQKSRDAKKKEMDLASGMLVRSKRR